MEMKVKILSFYLYTIHAGWMYILENNYFQLGDIITDGTKEYKIRSEEIIPSPVFRWPTPYKEEKIGEYGYLYHFEEKIEDFENKVFVKL